MFVPKRMFLTKGVGKHREKLTSFELALRSAGIAACNLVRVSSIFPPRCKLVSRDKGVKELKPGQVTFVVPSRAARLDSESSATTLGLSFLLADYRLISGVTTRTRKDAAAGWQMATDY